ncbi:MAG: vWA domain-containing protein, partial [Acidimicrobiia bacterium]
VGIDDQEQVYWAGRATLVRRPEDIEDYERCFDTLFGIGAPRGMVTTDVVPEEVVVAYDLPGGAPSSDETEPVDPDVPVLQVRYSPAEVLRHRDFATYSPAEHAEARQLMADLRFVGGLRRSRRSRRSRRTRGRPELRRTVRQSLRTGGEPIRRAFTEKSERPRRLVFLCDVSGSMEPYARALVRFLHTVVIARGRVEVFALGTRMTRITRELSSRDPDAALASAARRVVDWSGGTRLGEGLRAFNDEWGIRGMARGATVVVISDGWERGDADELAEQMARLHRVAHKIVWVNPLKATPGYAPLAAGMAAALPYIDEFVEGHSLASLEALAAVLA